LAQLGMALLASYLTDDEPQLVRDAVELLEQAERSAPAPVGKVRRTVCALIGLALSCALAGRFLNSAPSDPADGRRALDLMSAVDLDAAAELVPDVGTVMRQVEHTVRRGMAVAGVVTEADPPRSAAGRQQTPGAATHWGRTMRSLVGRLDATGELLESAQSYLTAGSLQPLDERLAAARRELDAAQATDDPNRGTLLVLLAQLHHLRYRNLRLSDLPDARRDLDEAIRLADLASAEDDPHAAGEISCLRGSCLLDRYLEDLGSPPDLDDAVRLLRRGAAHGEPMSRTGLARQLPLVEALLARAWRDGAAEDLDEAEDILLTLLERMREVTPARQLIAVRLANLRMHRAAGTGDTEDLLRASRDGRQASEDAGQVSAIWGYDAAMFWASWSWERAPMSERADAYQRAVACLHRLARNQLSRTYSEIALRRRSGGVTARAMYALARTERPVEAVVAAETGRAVLLAIALDAKRPVLSDAVDPRLRHRFQLAADRLAAAEADAARTVDAQAVDAQAVDAQAGPAVSIGPEDGG
jgi:hypothetical protein